MVGAGPLYQAEIDRLQQWLEGRRAALRERIRSMLPIAEDGSIRLMAKRGWYVGGPAPSSPDVANVARSRRRCRHVRMAGLSSREAANLGECPSQGVQCVVGAGLDRARRNAESFGGLRDGRAAEVALEQYLPVFARERA